MKIKILFVCLGNICRSPLAEAVFKYKIAQYGVEKHFLSDSCGTSRYHVGSSPDSRAIHVAAKHGITIDHVGRQIRPQDAEEYHYIPVMDHSNYATLLQRQYIAGFKDKLFLIRHFEPSSEEEVPDPYYGNESDFDEVFDILNKSVEGFIAYLKTKHPDLFL